jgi:hypothetical protein
VAAKRSARLQPASTSSCPAALKWRKRRAPAEKWIGWRILETALVRSNLVFLSPFVPEKIVSVPAAGRQLIG